MLFIHQLGRRSAAHSPYFPTWLLSLLVLESCSFHSTARKVKCKFKRMTDLSFFFTQGKNEPSTVPALMSDGRGQCLDSCQHQHAFLYGLRETPGKWKNSQYHMHIWFSDTFFFHQQPEERAEARNPWPICGMHPWFFFTVNFPPLGTLEGGP